MKRFLKTTFRILNWVAISALLLSYLAPFISPEFFWPISFFGLAYKGILLGFILLAILGVFFKTKMLFRNIILIFIGLPFLFRVYSVNPRKTANFEEKKHLKVVSFNTYALGKYNSKNTANDILDFLVSNDIGFANLIEFRFNGAKIDKSIYPYQFKLRASPNQNGGILIVSKYPILNSGIVPFKVKSNNIAGYVDLKFNEKVTRFYAIHLETTRVKSQDYKVLKKLEFGSTSTYQAKNLAQRLKYSLQKRAQQVDDIKKHMEDCPYASIILGDLNDTPQSYSYQQLLKGKNDAFVEAGHGFEATYLKPFPFLRIDFILADKSIECLNYGSTDSIYSDHKLIFADLLINK